MNKLKILIKEFIDKKMPKYFIKNRFLSSLYYFLFSSQFKREQFFVLNGKNEFLLKIKSNQSNDYLLVRNIHRIEKGLLMKNRRTVFALDFIEETVSEFIKKFNSNSNFTNQNKWFFDVLNMYFKVCDDTNIIINEQRMIFYDHLKSIDKETKVITAEGEKVPYKRSIAPNILYDEFYNLTKYRRSVRWFLDKKVPHDLIDKAILSASQSPSACNRQPFHYRIIDDPLLLNKIIKYPMGIKGYEKGIPMMIVVVGELDAYFNERDRHLIYIDASLANMTLMLALETLGLSSCPVNWPDIEYLEKKMEKLLDLDNFQRPIMCIAVGYHDPNEKVAFSEKKGLDVMRKFN